MYMNKSDIVKLGARLGVPFELSWSCYHGYEEPCGVCESCIRRRRAFEEAGLDEVGVDLKR